MADALCLWADKALADGEAAHANEEVPRADHRHEDRQDADAARTVAGSYIGGRRGQLGRLVAILLQRRLPAFQQVIDRWRADQFWQFARFQGSGVEDKRLI